MELSGEYIGPDGQRRQLGVTCDSPGDADAFQSLLSGIAQMRELVAEHFDPLVQREAQDRLEAAPDEDVNGDDEDDEEDEKNTENRTNSEGPSAKRPKPPP